MSNPQTRSWFHFGTQARITTTPTPRPPSSQLRPGTTRLETVTSFPSRPTSVPPQPRMPPPSRDSPQPQPPPPTVVQVIPTTVVLKPTDVLEPKQSPSLQTLNLRPKIAPSSNQLSPRSRNPEPETPPSANHSAPLKSDGRVNRITVKPAVSQSGDSDTEESRARATSLAGENRGAVMEITRSHKKGHTRVLNSISEEEGGKKKKLINPKDTDDYVMRYFMNSNVQGINNSIVYNSSSAHNNPGVHLTFPMEHEHRSGKKS